MLLNPDMADRIADLMARIVALGREQQRAQHSQDFGTSNRLQHEIAELDRQVDELRKAPVPGAGRE